MPKLTDDKIQNLVSAANREDFSSKPAGLGLVCYPCGSELFAQTAKTSHVQSLKTLLKYLENCEESRQK